VISWGGNPQDAPLWLAGAVLLAGLALILVVRWLLDTVVALDAMRGAGGGTWLRFAISGVFSLLMTAILIRVIGSWLGVGRYNPWMRPLYRVTDWLVEPIRRRLPPFGAIDLSPVAAYLLLWLLRGAVLGALG
jgi:YggT family protein